MGFLRWLRERLQPRTCTDPLFGVLRFQRVGFWEGRAPFAPVAREVEVLIDADEDGPSLEQRAFYRELERRYDTLTGPLGDLLHEAYTNWKEDFPRPRIWEEFRLVAIDVPGGDVATASWELSFDCRSDDHSFDVQMRGWTPEGVAING